MFFRDIPGYDDLKNRLIRSVHENRISHAQLLYGTEGVPKLALALAYGQYINCRARTETDSCGVCASCAKYAHLAHPDLHFIFPVATTKVVDSKPRSKDFLTEWRELVLESGGDFNLYDLYQKVGISESKQAIINADDAAEVVRTLSLKAFEADYKVLILWMVEKMNATSANRLLKVLEEPPEKTLFLLITEDPDQILSTILSRTQMIKIRSWTEGEMAGILSQTFGLTVEESNRIALLSDGNWLTAKKMALSGGKEGASSADFIEWLRDVFRLGTAKSWQEGNLAVLERAGLFARMGRESQKAFLLMAMRMIRFVMLQSLGTPNLVKLDGAEAKFSSDFSRFVHVDNAHLYYEHLQEAYSNIERNANAQLLFADLSYQLESVLRIPPPVD
jgi:DNA polymerase-3 subunit delta'